MTRSVLLTSAGGGVTAALSSSSAATTADGFKIGTRVVGKIKKNLNATGVIVAIADGGRVEVQWDHVPEVNTVTTRAIAVLADDEDPSKQPPVVAKSTMSSVGNALRKSGLIHDVAELGFEKGEAEKKPAATRRGKRKTPTPVFPAVVAEDDASVNSTDEEDDHHEEKRSKKVEIEASNSFEGEVIDPTSLDCPFHVIRSLLKLPMYEHLSRTTARPKRRCAMKGCGKHTSFYCVKCTTALNMGQATGKRARVYAICSPTVQNANYCFYQHCHGATTLGNVVHLESDLHSHVFAQTALTASVKRANGKRAAAPVMDDEDDDSEMEGEPADEAEL